MAYEYINLPKDPGHIRLLGLLPGKSNEDIETFLIHDDLKKKPLYDALSYVWGNSDITSPISVNDCQFDVTINLKAALHRLRHEEECKMLWIDAICINQKNVEERSDQVNQMRDIYEHAKNVVVWLGEEAENSAEAFRFLEEVNSSRDPDNAFRSLIQQGEEKWRVLLRLFSRPYWERMWIVQEVVVAHSVTVHCGEKSLPWLCFVTTASMLEKFSSSLHFWNSAGFDSERFTNHVFTLNILQIREANGQRLSILSLLAVHGKHRAKDSRDKIFALLGLMEDKERYALKADYGKDISRLFKELVKTLVEVHERLDVLTFCHLQKKLPGLPSWTPDWSTETHETNDLPIGYHPGQTCPHQAEGNRRKALARFSDDLNKLTLKGIRFDKVQSVGPDLQVKKDLGGRRYATLDAELNTIINQATAYGPAASIDELVWRTLVANRTLNGQVAPSEFGQMFKIWSRELSTAAAWSSSDVWAHNNAWVGNNITTQQEKILPFLQALERSLKNRRLTVSSNGYLGLAPSQTRNGDILCIILGAGVPFVLRPCGTNYQIVGEAYFHGVMDGQVMEEFDRGNNLQLEDLQLI